MRNKIHPQVLINIYKKLTKKELLEIKPKWAFGEDLFADFDEDIFAWVNTKELIEKMEFGAMGGDIDPYVLFSDRENGNQRITKILDRWKNRTLVDPPSIHSDRLGKITFGDGRHRLITAFHLGAKRVPVAIHKSNRETISKFLDLNFIN